MKVKIEFDEDHLLKVTTDQGEELRCYDRRVIYRYYQGQNKDLIF